MKLYLVYTYYYSGYGHADNDLCFIGSTRNTALRYIEGIRTEDPDMYEWRYYPTRGEEVLWDLDSRGQFGYRYYCIEEVNTDEEL